MARRRATIGAPASNLRQLHPNRTGIARHAKEEPFCSTSVQAKGTIVPDVASRLQRLSIVVGRTCADRLTGPLTCDDAGLHFEVDEQGRLQVSC